MKLSLKKSNAFISVLLVMVMMFGFMPATSQPVMATTTCDWAQFVADVTVPDGTYFSAGASFNKTWRLKNIGTCTWTSGYSLVFVDGSQMGAPASVALTANVAPGGTVDLTAAMTAPSAAGTYRGNWKLKNAIAVQFGIGAGATSPFWVEIKIAGSGGTGYDFAANGASAIWSSATGILSFPGADGDANGFAKKLDAPVLENGSTGSAGLLTVPQNAYYGYIQGIYPAYTVQSGDRFQSIVNCEYNATSCYVNFRLNYQIGSGAVQTLWSFNEAYEGAYYSPNIDLSFLAGQSVKFILYVGAAGYGAGDRAVWSGPRIVGSGSVSPTVTPGGPTVTPSPTASSSSCDRVTFIEDVNVPDGTVFAPNATFTKTWRVKNVGTCTWTTSYTLVYVSGNQMGGTTPINLASTVPPNTSFNISVNLTAPSAAGSYRGYWQFKNGTGQLFGIGAAADKPWWVDIVVSGNAAATNTPSSSLVTPTPSTPAPTPSGTIVFDFTTNPGTAAEWKNGSGAVLTFGGTTGDSGYANKVTTVQLEDGVTYTDPSLVMVPENLATDGYVQGLYTTAYTVVSGDRFKARIGCQSGFPSCTVKYWVLFKVGDTIYTILDRTEAVESPGMTPVIDAALTALIGKTGNFIIAVGANGAPTDDHAPWIHPRIER